MIAKRDVPNEGVTLIFLPALEVSVCRPEELAPLLEEVLAALDRLDYPSHDRVGIRLAIEEAVVNGLRHGNQGDPAKAVHTRVWVGPDAVLAEVEDEGPGFDPDGVPDPTRPENLDRPGGRGLLLMRHFMTQVRFSDRGNRVILHKRRST